MLPRPFIKWAGGKSRLLKQFAQLFPKNFNSYYEPFVGGGSVFFYFFRRGKIRNIPVWINDNNEELINTYFVIRDSYDELYNELIQQNYVSNDDNYQRIRSLEPRKLGNIERAARFIFLSKTCYNGLYRVNSKGEMNQAFDNTTMGKELFNFRNFIEISNALQNVRITCQDFEIILNETNRNSFIYLDPPYIPLSETSNFRGYTADSFHDSDHIRLREAMKRAHNKGVKIMLSNSDTKRTREIYNILGFHIDEVLIMRGTSPKGETRGVIKELVIRNYIRDNELIQTTIF